MRILDNHFIIFHLSSKTEIWDLDLSSITAISPELPNDSISLGGIFLFGANECRKSGESSLGNSGTITFCV